MLACSRAVRLSRPLLLASTSTRQSFQGYKFHTRTSAMADSIKRISTDKAMQPAGPYSQATVIPPGPTIFVSGQIPVNPDGSFVEGTIGEKTATCIRGLQAILTEAGSSLEKVVKVNIFLTDMANFAEMNEEYGKWFTTKPARSCVAVSQLPKGVDVELECIAIQ